MAKRTERKTKARQAAETAFLSMPDSPEAEACLTAALADSGVPEEAAAKAASAFGESLKVTKAAWRASDPSCDPSFDDGPSPEALSKSAKNLLLALVKQRQRRPHPSNWIRLDKDLAKHDAKLEGQPDSAYEAAFRELIESGLVSLRVVVGKKESIPCFRINPKEGSR